MAIDLDEERREKQKEAKEDEEDEKSFLERKKKELQQKRIAIEYDWLDPNKPAPPVKQYVPPIPFSQRLHKNKMDSKFSNFLNVFKKLQINIPFVEALEQMPGYAKFIKDILSKKKKWVEHETVQLTEECSAILQRKLPIKRQDPESFTIPCIIGTILFDKALCDLGYSVNLMTFSIAKHLGLGEVASTNVSLQMADRSITYPYGIIEDVLVKVDKLVFPADFIVLDMEEDVDTPIILGRPFLATGRTLIDVEQGMFYVLGDFYTVVIT
ncbi:uncharacterized protein LOC119986907 [Tripterygium wilfordii]|uniref:uncharacterized protein LOC119986907 n=1 Tax=Tripterygium wilfordii TaxID=458696 RepID=UPI0018F803DC|nr:uncharacterized protein LOC119986907 [Tripterygium wilfordii]